MRSPIDWMLVATVAGPLLAVLLGAWLNHLLEGRPRLLSYLVHASAITTSRQPGGQAPITVHTHSIVVRNTSRKPAQNVRLGHRALPDFTIFPSMAFRVEPLPDGSHEIVIPTLVPSEQFTVSYLYFPPLTFDKINAYTKSDEGYARIVRVLPSPQPSRAVIIALGTLVVVGACTLFYLAAKVVASWL